MSIATTPIHTRSYKIIEYIARVTKGEFEWALVGTYYRQ